MLRLRRHAAQLLQQLSLFSPSPEVPPPPARVQRPRRAAPAPPLAEQFTKRLAPYFEGRLGRLTLTDNRTSLLSSRRGRDGLLAVRAHHRLAAAPDELLPVIAALAGGRLPPTARRAAVAAVRELARATEPEGSEPPPARRRRPVVGPAAGRVYHLEALRDEINQTYFGGRLEVAIGWGRGGKGAGAWRRRRGGVIHLGTWHEADRLVRIHPVLDHPTVPRYVVASVVHHELLHAELGAVHRGGRRYVHTAEFRRRERDYEFHEAAQRWIREHFRELDQRRRRGPGAVGRGGQTR